MCIACADSLRGIFSFPALPAAQIGCSLRILAMSERLKGHLFILATNTIFGVFIPVSKYLLNGYVSPMMLTCFRIVGATLLFWTASFFISDNKVTWKALLWFLFFALTGIVFNQGLFIFGLRHTSPVDASVILTATPFSALFISALYFGDKITGRKLLGIATGAAGAIWLIITAAGSHSGNSGSILGNAIVLVTTICAAIYFVTSKPMTKYYTSFTMMKWMFTFSTLMLWPFFYSECKDEFLGLSNLGFGAWAGILYVVVAATFLAYLFLPMGIKRMRPTTVAMYIYVQPIVSSIVAIIVGQDSFMWSKVFASVLVFIGVYIVTTSPRYEDKSAADSSN